MWFSTILSVTGGASCIQKREVLAKQQKRKETGVGRMQVQAQPNERSGRREWEPGLSGWAREKACDRERRVNHSGT